MKRIYILFLFLVALLLAGCGGKAADPNSPESLLDITMTSTKEEAYDKIEQFYDDLDEDDIDSYYDFYLYDLEFYGHEVDVDFYFNDNFSMDEIMPFFYYAEDEIEETRYAFFEEDYPEIAKDPSLIYLESGSDQMDIFYELEEFREEDPEFKKILRDYEREVEKIDDIKTPDEWLYTTRVEFNDELDEEERAQLIKNVSKQLGKPKENLNHGVETRWETKDAFVHLICNPTDEIDDFDEDFVCQLSKHIHQTYFKEQLKKQSE